MSGDHYNVYDEDYFLRGKETGKSLYDNYRWLPDLTIPMAKHIVAHCGIGPGARILDFGCARGYLVRALRELGHKAFGYDTSEWAVKNSDPEARPYMNYTPEGTSFWVDRAYSWVIAKDVLEHVSYVDGVINRLLGQATEGVFVVVPLTNFDNGKYTIDDYEKDVTHIQRMTLATWVAKFLRPGWRVEASYRVPGVKDNYYKPGWELGNGFITARRIKE